jgi:hypothetical protein
MRDNEKILQIAAEGTQHVREIAIALLQADADYGFVIEFLAAARVLQRAAHSLCDEQSRPMAIPANGSDARVPPTAGATVSAMGQNQLHPNACFYGIRKSNRTPH